MAAAVLVLALVLTVLLVLVLVVEVVMAAVVVALVKVVVVMVTMVVGVVVLSRWWRLRRRSWWGQRQCSRGPKTEKAGRGISRHSSRGRATDRVETATVEPWRRAWRGTEPEEARRRGWEPSPW